MNNEEHPFSEQAGWRESWILFTLLLLFSSSGVIRAVEGDTVRTFSNPVFKGADPWVYKTDSCYYYCFVYKKGLAVSKTKELHKKGQLVEVWKAPAEGWNRSCIWAPELHYVCGKWYIYYAAGESGPPYIHQRTGVLEAVSSDPQGAYIDKGMIYTGDNVDCWPDTDANRWAIDMTVFEWQKKLYAVWSGWENNESTDKHVRTCTSLKWKILGLYRPIGHFYPSRINLGKQTED